MMTARWTALILAGERPGPDPLATHFGSPLKALIPIAGEAMLTHVVRSLRQSPSIGRIVVLAQDPLALSAAADVGGDVDAFLSSESSISMSIAAVVGGNDADWPVLVTTADHPLLTPAMIEQFLQDADGADLAVGMVERDRMRTAFPENKRTWLKFSDGHWSGANLFALTSAKVLPALHLWSQAEQDRKIPVKLFRHFGLWLMLRAITRTIGLGNGLAAAGRRLGLNARLVSMHDPVAAIDVDKLSDHVLAEDILAARALAP